MLDPKSQSRLAGARERISHKRLLELFEYLPELGCFRRRIARRQYPAGALVYGSITSDGYRDIWVDSVNYNAHVLIWFYTTGNWPAALLDHKDGDRLNNRLDNLREATPSQNIANSRKRKGITTSRFKGVSRAVGRNTWQAAIRVNRRSIYLGRFPTEEQAAAAYADAATRFFGEFARVA